MVQVKRQATDMKSGKKRKRNANPRAKDGHGDEDAALGRRVERAAGKPLDEESGGAPGGVRTNQRDRLDRAQLGESDAAGGTDRGGS